MAGDALWFGSGGDAWKLQYTAYQQQPYVGTEVHSGYLDTLLDNGIFGLVLFAAILIIWAVRVGRREPMLLLPLAILFGHSAVDFDMNYGFFWFMVLWMVGVAGSSPIQLRKTDVDGKDVQLATSTKVNWSVRIVLLCTAAAILVFSSVTAFRFEAARISLFVSSSDKLPTAISRWKDSLNPVQMRQPGTLPDPSLHQRQSALYWMPYSMKYRLDLAEQLSADQAIPLLLEGLSYEPNNAVLLWQIGTTYAQTGDYNKADHYIKAALQLDRYDKSKHEKTIKLWLDAALQQQSLDFSDLTVQYAERAAKAFNQYKSLVQKVEQMRNPANGRKFELTGKAVEYYKQVQLLIKQEVN
jgi:hypothetical protein